MAWTPATNVFGEVGGYVGALAWVDDGDALVEFLGGGQSADNSKALTRSPNGNSWAHQPSPFDADEGDLELFHYASISLIQRNDFFGTTLIGGAIGGVQKVGISSDHEDWTIYDLIDEDFGLDTGDFGAAHANIQSAVCDQATGFMMFGSGGMMKNISISEDGGVTITPIVSPFAGGSSAGHMMQVVGLARSDDTGRIMALGTKNGSPSVFGHYTDDNGDNWTEITWVTEEEPDVGIGLGFVYGCFRDDDKGRWYAVGGANSGSIAVWISDDEMATWTPLSTPLDPNGSGPAGEAYKVIKLGGSTVLIIGRNYSETNDTLLIRSFDGGDTWRRELAASSTLHDIYTGAYSPSLDLAVLGVD